MLFPPEIIAAAQRSHQNFYPRGPFVSVILAQWALESGFGKHESGKNNFFGIQADAAQIYRGEFTSRLSWEEIGGHKIPRVEKFANYPTLEAGFNSHGALLCKHHYEDCINAQTPEAYCYALRRDGYATASNYSEALISLIKEHGLKQYDQIPDQIFSHTN